MKLIRLLVLLLFANSFAQKGFQISDSKKAVIPFQLINNLIFIPVNINGVNLTFLLDSGVKETILFSMEDKEVNFSETEKIKFTGLGESMDIEGLSSEKNVLSIGKDFKDTNHAVFIILDERINFSSHVGIPVNGIIGYQFFKNHSVEINYFTKKITVFKDEEFKAKRVKRFEEFPISIEGNKPYIMADIEMSDEKVNSKMLIDLGNSDAIWLFPKLIDNFEYNRPNIDDYLGRGFNGDIFGKRSRIHRLYLGDYLFEKPLIAMPDVYSIQNLKLVPNRKGSVGNEIMRRFNVIFDYPGGKIFLRKNNNYRDPFLFNNIGLDIMQDGLTWEKDKVSIETKTTVSLRTGEIVRESSENFAYNFTLKPKFTVAGCRKDSPCFVAGIRKNDQLISINKKTVGDMSLQKINNYFKQRNDKKLNLEVERNDKVLNFIITLEDPIPYQNSNSR